MHRLFLITLLLCCTTQPLAAQTQRQTNPSASRPPSTARVGRQWEYLVVSFGKAYFSEPNLQPETKTTGLSKLISYSKAGVVSAQEALIMQSQMDTLGKFGWELMSIVGVIGGDQEMVFRRPYDPDQSKAEANLIREEGERLLAAQREVTANLAQADFVDLDEIERAQLIAETRQKEEARLKAVIQGLNNPAITSVRVVSTATPGHPAVTADITLDGSAQLLKEGNKYRESEARAMAGQVAMSIFQAARLVSRYTSDSPYLRHAFGDVKISVSVQVSYQGKQKIVATGSDGGNWPER